MRHTASYDAFTPDFGLGDCVYRLIRISTDIALKDVNEPILTNSFNTHATLVPLVINKVCC